MKKTKAESILNNKVILAEGLMVEMKIWEVQRGPKYQDGYKYSLYAVYRERVIVGHENHSPKGQLFVRKQISCQMEIFD